MFEIESDFETPGVSLCPVSAINFCIALYLEKGYRNAKVTILSDSHEVIKAVSKLDCLKKLLHLAKYNEVTIYVYRGTWELTAESMESGQLSSQNALSKEPDRVSSLPMYH